MSSNNPFDWYTDLFAEQFMECYLPCDIQSTRSLNSWIKRIAKNGRHEDSKKHVYVYYPATT